MYELKTEASFDAAHFLSDYEGKCENLHGHRWRVVAFLSQHDLVSSGQEKGMVMDFSRFKKALRAIVGEFDHAFLVEEGSLSPQTIACLEAETFKLTFLPFRTTTEQLAKYFFGQLKEEGYPVSRIEVYETPLNCASYSE